MPANLSTIDVAPAPVVAVSAVSGSQASTVLQPPVSCVTPNSAEFDFTPAPLDMPTNTFLKPIYFVLPCGSVFTDKQIPRKIDNLISDFTENSVFTKDYFVNLHYLVAETGNYNYAGARVELPHNRLRVDRFRDLLPKNFDDLAVLQFMQFGFALGLKEDYVFRPSLRRSL